MVEFGTAMRRVVRRSALTGLGLLAAMLGADPALARHHHHGHLSHYASQRGHARHAHARMIAGPEGTERPRFVRVRSGGYTPPFSAYAVDGNSGRVLYGQDENALRHPASITKVMTLYLLFGELEKGRMSLDTRIPVSTHAAAQKPTKLGLRPGSTIRVEDAIKSIVTKSANDMAVTIAEAIGGDEPSFARMMTRKAHALGMSRSNFVNASGLPADEQWTTARDLATLGRAIHDHYPQYFRFFSTPSFTYAGQFMANHNHLMEQVDGMDGIKTGYTRDSGFNLLSSVNRDGHWLVSVVLGGKTRLGRDRIMADLISSEIDKCATHRTAPMVAENPELEHVAEAIPVVTHEGDAAPPVEGVDEEVLERRAPRHAEAAAVAEPSSEAPETKEADAEQDASPQPAPPEPTRAHRGRAIEVAAEEPDTAHRARPAFVSAVPMPPDRDMLSTGSIRRRHAWQDVDAHADGSTGRYEGEATATPSRRGRHTSLVAAEGRPVRVASLVDVPQPSGRPAKSGWMIQIGAPESVAKANDLLARARGQSRGALARAQTFTEKVQKGGATLYRARFAGLEPEAAEAACRNLKRSGMTCFTTRN